MPITSIDSYRPTTLAFYDNWGTANSELGTGAIVLAGNYNRDDFDTDRQNMLSAMDNVQALGQAFRSKAEARDKLKVALSPRVTQFRFALQAQVPDANLRKRAPQAPSVTADIARFTEPLKAMAQLWSEINLNATTFQLPGPLTLQGGYTQMQFQADILSVQTLSDEAATAERLLNTQRGALQNLLAAIYERLKQYRAGVMAQLPKNSPARETLPRLTPLPGTTPPPLVVTGAWDNQLGQARLTWEASSAKDSLKLQVRACTGGTYRSENEEIVADLANNATHWEGDWGLTVPGSIASFKVYVMTTTGNENGGKATKIVRPVPQG